MFTEHILCKMLVMTTPENHQETVQFFKDNEYFGGFPENFVFFQQQMLPAVNFEGKILMQSPSQIKLAPNGNGALFDAIKNNSEVKEIISKLAYVQIVGVDNAINKILDPLFIGYAMNNSLTAALKAVERDDENEPVGVVAVKNGITEIVEYTELPEMLRKQRHPSKEPAGYFYTPPPGPLVFNNGHILVFLIDA